MKTTKKLSILMMSAFFLLAACKKEEMKTEDDSNVNSTSREFKVNMTDAPGDYESLIVEIESVEIYSENSGWITLNNETQFVSVLDLTNGAEMELGAKQDVELGAYSKLRLNFGDNHQLEVNGSVNLEVGDLVVSSDLSVDLDWEGPKSIEIEINEEVTASQSVDLLIDFNVAQSIIQDGENYLIRPVITEIEDRSTGVEGKVEGSVNATLLLTNGEDTLSSSTNAEGEFLIRGMAEGMYELIAFPHGEEGEILMSEERIEGVIVTQGEIKNAGTIQF